MSTPLKHVLVTEETHKRLRIAAAHDNISVCKFLERIVENYFEKEYMKNGTEEKTN